MMFKRVQGLLGALVLQRSPPRRRVAAAVVSDTPSPRFLASCETEADWRRVFHDIVAALPPLRPGSDTPSPTVRRGQALSDEAVCRVLVEWLAGGSAAEVGRRSGVSRRSVYAALERTLYGRPNFKDWQDLRLIACVIAPACPSEGRPFGSTAVCMVCLEPIATCSSSLPKNHVGVRQDAALTLGRPREDWDEVRHRTHAHLLLHWWLGLDPKGADVLAVLFRKCAWWRVPGYTFDVLREEWQRVEATPPPPGCRPWPDEDQLERRLKALEWAWKLADVLERANERRAAEGASPASSEG